MDNFSKYEKLYAKGVTARQVYPIAQADGLNFSACIRMLRQVFHLSLIEAKEVSVVAKGEVNSLMEYQEKLLPLIKVELDNLERQKQP